MSENVIARPNVYIDTLCRLHGRPRSGHVELWQYGKRNLPQPYGAGVDPGILGKDTDLKIRNDPATMSRAGEATRIERYQKSLGPGGNAESSLVDSRCFKLPRHG